MEHISLTSRRPDTPLSPISLVLTALVATALVAAAAGLALSSPSHAQDQPPQAGGETAPKRGADGEPGAKSDAPDNAPQTQPRPEPEGSMTLARMGEIIKRLDANAANPTPNSWQFTISKRPVMIITDPKNNRMRILSPVADADSLSEDVLKRMMQANFDTALDARYALARGAVWATFIHPLRALHDRQFISAIGQTVNLALTFGTTFSSGAMSFGGGDSREIIRKQLIEDLLNKGLPA
ncbi:MAG: type III secretion system chaperone [Pseudomonadota bacterium]